MFNIHIQTSKVVSILQVGSFLKEEHSIGVTKKESKKRKYCTETLYSNFLQETQSNNMDIDKNNTGLINPEPEREENQPTDTLKANILHEAHTETNTLDEDKNNIAPFHDEEQNGSEFKTGMSSLLSQPGSTEGTKRTMTGVGKKIKILYTTKEVCQENLKFRN